MFSFQYKYFFAFPVSYASTHHFSQAAHLLPPSLTISGKLVFLSES